MATEKGPILLVEDSPEDCEATVRAIRRSLVDPPIVHCSDGDEALDYLYRRGKHANPWTSSRPCLILLDLNLPGTDGREVLLEIKQDPRLRGIPVIVFTTSSDQSDIEVCYQAGANSYVQKPADLHGLFTTMENVSDFWFEIAAIPNGRQA